MVTSTQSKHYVGTNQPIVIEFTYEEWRRLSRLSNLDDRWIIKFYNAILKKAGLKELGNSNRSIGSNIDYPRPSVQEVVCGYRAYAKYEAILKKKVDDKTRPFLNLDIGPSNVLRPGETLTPDQIMIRPIAFGSHTWNKNDFR